MLSLSLYKDTLLLSLRVAVLSVKSHALMGLTPASSFARTKKAREHEKMGLVTHIYIPDTKGQALLKCFRLGLV